MRHASRFLLLLTALLYTPQAGTAQSSSAILPDLVVTRIWVSSGTWWWKKNVDIEVTVKNIGVAPTTSTFFAEFNYGKARRGHAKRFDTAILFPGFSKTWKATFTAPPCDPQNNYVKVIVDPNQLISELNEDNNSLQLNLRSCISDADMAISHFSASTTSWKANESIRLVSRTTNKLGPMHSNATVAHTGYFLSRDRTWDANDTFVGSYTYPQLGMGGYWHHNQDVKLPANVTPGTCYLLAVANLAKANGAWVARPDYNRSNNVAVIQGKCVEALPDLQISNFTTTSLDFRWGRRMTLVSRTTNVGDATAPASMTGYYLSPHTTQSNTDTLLATVSVPVLGSTGWWQTSTPVTIPKLSYNRNLTQVCYLHARSDRDRKIRERSEVNNDASIRGLCTRKPDLVVDSLKAATTLYGGLDTTTIGVVRNIGDGNAPAHTLGCFLSTDSTITKTDILGHTWQVPALSPGRFAKVSARWKVPVSVPHGRCYVGYFADYKGQVSERNETNNTRVVERTCVGAPDCVVKSITPIWNPTFVAGASFDLNVVLENQGYLRTLRSIDVGVMCGPSGTPLTVKNGLKISPEPRITIAARATRTLRLKCKIPHFFRAGPSGQLVLGAYVDSRDEVEEASETNNLLVTPPMPCSDYTGSDRVVEFTPRVGAATHDDVTLFVGAGPRSVELNVTAPQHPKDWYLRLWSGQQNGTSDAFTNFGLSILNSAVMPAWFGQLDAQGRTSTIKPALHLLTTPIPSAFTTYTSALFFSPSFSTVTGLSTNSAIRTRVEK